MSKKLSKQLKKIKLDKTTHFDKIQASFFDDKIELSQYQKDLKKRWMTAFSLLRTMLSFQQVSKRLMDEFGVSQATAYRDIDNATALFGNINQVNTDGVKVILREAYWRVYQQALKSGDLDMQIKALNAYKELFDWGDDDDKKAMADKIQAHEYKLTIPREIMKDFKKMLGTGVVDFNNFGVEDAEYEDMTNEETDENN